MYQSVSSAGRSKANIYGEDKSSSSWVTRVICLVVTVVIVFLTLWLLNIFPSLPSPLVSSSSPSSSTVSIPTTPGILYASSPLSQNLSVHPSEILISPGGLWLYGLAPTDQSISLMAWQHLFGRVVENNPQLLSIPNLSSDIAYTTSDGVYLLLMNTTSSLSCYRILSQGTLLYLNTVALPSTSPLLSFTESSLYSVIIASNNAKQLLLMTVNYVTGLNITSVISMSTNAFSTINGLAMDSSGQWLYMIQTSSNQQSVATAYLSTGYYNNSISVNISGSISFVNLTFGTTAITSSANLYNGGLTVMGSTLFYIDSTKFSLCMRSINNSTGVLGSAICAPTGQQPVAYAITNAYAFVFDLTSQTFYQLAYTSSGFTTNAPAQAISTSFNSGTITPLLILSPFYETLCILVPRTNLLWQLSIS
jgi:hypothetical protein